MSNYSFNSQTCSKNLRNWPKSQADCKREFSALTEISDDDLCIPYDSSYSMQSMTIHDQIPIGSTKPFEVLLEEKLAENDDAVQVIQRPKKPFLKKGTGLQRYKSNHSAPVVNRRRYKKNEPQSYGSKLKSLRINHKTDVDGGPMNLMKKKPCSAGNLDLTPLRAPEGMIRSKTNFFSFNNDSFAHSLDNQRSRESIKKSKDYPSIGGIKMMEWMTPLDEECEMSPIKNRPNGNNFPNSEPNFEGTIGYERHSIIRRVEKHSPPNFEYENDKELHIFEALEKRADNTSFCSTNSSIMRILASTPHREKNGVSVNSMKTSLFGIKDKASPSRGKEALENKLKMLDQKTEVINNFIMKLKENQVVDSTIESSVDNENTDDYSDDHHSEDIESPPSSPREGQFNNTIKPSIGATPLVNNTRKSDSNNERCLDCEKKDDQLLLTESSAKKLQEEVEKLYESNIVLQRENDEIERQMRKMGLGFEKEKADWIGKIAELEKKLHKERAQFDSLKRTTQNWKKEREDISNLRQELTETKELFKLKETKNATVQARLRSQLKTLEKDNAELTIKVEQLTKDKAKLVVSQKLTRRPSDTKMLNEINKSIAKLTEETLQLKRNQKSPKSPIKENFKEKKSSSSLEKGDKTDKNDSVESSEYSKLDNFGTMSLEKQYQNVFGCAKLPQQNMTLNESSRREKRETILDDGTKEIKYSNGNVKIISPDGNSVMVKYYNGDIKETRLDKQIVKYFYSTNNTWHTTYSDGTEYFEFPSGQSEKKYADGRCEIFYPDGVLQTKYTDGTETVKYTDGSELTIQPDGIRTLMFVNGQKEIHTPNEKRREYPDGTVKILYPDGSQETRYSTGRIRRKDPDGNLIYDTKVLSE